MRLVGEAEAQRNLDDGLTCNQREGGGSRTLDAKQRLRSQAEPLTRSALQRPR
jgi:hypothetical protein